MATSTPGLHVLRRAYLFVPADRPERFAKARASGADAVIVDLEDAVAPEAKASARDALATALDASAPLVVRINAAGTPWFEDDLELCRHPGVAAVMLPKAEGIDAVCTVVEITYKDVLPIIESARGLREIHSIASVPGVIRLAFGSVDLALDLGIDCAPDGAESELLAFRSQVVLASRLAGLAAPVDGVSTAIEDLQRLQADTERSRRLGFGAKLCIHPKQLAIVQAVFTPTPERLDWARRVCKAFETAGGSAVAVDSQMVDLPVYQRAQAVLRDAGLSA
ncbi:MAG: HpcH/HpaI aldolase/citrate lyase family protein [Hydrogenophaga sp.]|uniref:HpcH/HpaI aldolase/citrate lyase family protein n=2 Tax=Hydrogenophaga TaxID=47420 RepID=UPI0006F4D86C|nr:CoA ester lyase [Hydrogenophaga sp.]KRB95746.1 aldolase [Hydrogenophaga sp. Root209]MDZ4143387.1 CoA ester lyase [Burkholderiales bacterium]OSZ76497.1 CoA ester lyase [Hydrogenophaga sp. IBVHS1]MDZ4399744.1 CoA ester lyase [Hydrogenophaga sp.]PZO21506.1 MAG: CoA ester lyase [Burkholderiales bacterium]